jgi:DNA gyrase subunit B
MKDTKYKDDSIISLSPRDFTRLRPSTYLGSNEYSTQLVKEAFANALDEHNIGHGNLILININTKENSYEIIDEGQGFIVNSLRSDGKTVLEAAFSVLNTSGKYDDSKNGVYQGSSLGVNGIGSKLITFLSLKTEVKTYDSSGNFEYIVFKDGIFEKRVLGKEEHHSGTLIKWIPDPQFFQNKEVNINDLRELFKGISALCPKITIKLIIDNKEEIFHSDQGIQSLIKTGNEILKNRFICRKEEDNHLFDICMTYINSYSETIIAYANYGLTESGVHISTVRASLTRQINKYATDNNLLKKKDELLTQAELNEGLILIFNIKATNVKYDSQTKTKIVDIDKTLINQVINNEFVDWLNNNPKDVKIIIDKALTARKAKEAAQKAKDAARGLKVRKDKFIDLPNKLVDATPRDKDRSKCILYCVEGDSAANGICSKRDAQIHGIMPLRGKILSVRKASIQDMMKNQEISNIIKALGLEINIKTYTLKYDIKKLRYHKIVLLEDGDPDGAAIRMLLITLFWRLCPELVINGHLFSSCPPLYKLTDKQNKYYYCTDDEELKKFKKLHKNETFTQNRLKGLGEMSPDELYECMIKEGNNNIMQITVDDIEECDNILEIFMGTKVDNRREYYNNHYNDVEISIE